MPVPMDLPTYRDVLDHLIDYQHGSPAPYVHRNARRAIIHALRVLANSYQWPYWTQVGRVNTHAPYNTGTVTYDHTGGAYERVLTLTGGTWPDWAAYGIVVIGATKYSVAERQSSTQLQLEVYHNPGEDIAESSYELFRDAYTLPVDCRVVDHVYSSSSYTHLDYVHPREWLRGTVYHSSASGYPVRFTVTGDPDFQGQLAIRVDPYPDSAMALDFIYQRRPRSNNVEGVHAGTASVDASNVSVSGEGTSWTDTMVGSLIRFSNNDTDLPTGLEGSNPYTLERTVMQVVSGTHLMLDQPAPETLSGVKTMISDPIDIEPGGMEVAFYRCCESQLAKTIRTKDRAEVERDFQMELERAKNASVPTTAPRHAGQTRRKLRLSDMPTGADVE